MQLIGTSRSRWGFWLGLLVSAAALVVALHGVQWRELGRAMLAVRPGLIAIGMLCTLLELLAGAWRWRMLIAPLGRFKLIRECSGWFMIGTMANQVLPLRPGEVIRSYWFARRHGLSRTSMLAAVVAEKLCDVVTLVLLMVGVALLTPIPGPVRVGGLAIGAAAVAAALVLIWAVRHPAAGVWLSACLRWLPPSLRETLEGLGRRTAEGLGVLRSAGRLSAVLAASLVVWLAGILVTQCYLWAFHLDLPWYAPALVLVVVNLGMTIPSSPGAIGVAQLLYIVALALFGVDRETALAFGIGIRGICFLEIVVLGVLALWREGLKWEALRNDR
jgi:glycosyltransferase 2 family protein